MDASLIVQLVASALTGASAVIGGYWVYLRQTKERRETATQAQFDSRVNDLKEYQERERDAWDRERRDLRERLAQATTIAAQNTTALEESNANGELLAAQLNRLLTILEPGPERR